MATKRMTKKRRDELCGGPPTLTLACSFCSRKVGPYYFQTEATAALKTHLSYIHFTDQVRPIPFRS